MLLAEDDRLLRELATSSLRKANFTVIEVDSGEAAMAVLAAGQRIHMLITDICMGGRLDGWDLAEQVRELDADVRVLYMTSGKRDPARQVPGSLFVQKPYRIQTLLTAARKLAGPA